MKTEPLMWFFLKWAFTRLRSASLMSAAWYAVFGVASAMGLRPQPRSKIIFGLRESIFSFSWR